MNTYKLTTAALFIVSLTMNSCAQTSEKPASKPATKTSTSKTTPLPPHSYTYNPPSKTTTTKSSAAKTVTTKATTSTKTVSKTATAKTTATKAPAAKTTTTSNTNGDWKNINMNTGRAIAPNPMQTGTQPINSTTTNTSTQSSQTTPSGKAQMGQGSSTTTGNTSSGSSTTPSGKSQMGQNSSSGSSGSGTGNILNTVLGNGTGSFTETDAASAIKEALMKGVTTGVNKVSVTDGYFKNNMIKIPFPQDAQVVETTLRNIGMGSLIDNLVLSLNRAAENAATQAGPIFLNGIKQMTVTDAVNIVSNQQPDAATKFLQRTTTESLVSAFKPSIQAALDKTLATKYWKDIMSNYNKIPFVQKVNPDLNDFVTRKAISGLFYMIAQEEAKIRKDPVARTSDLLQKVFGNIKF